MRHSSHWHAHMLNCQMGLTCMFLDRRRNRKSALLPDRKDTGNPTQNLFGKKTNKKNIRTIATKQSGVGCYFLFLLWFFKCVIAHPFVFLQCWIVYTNASYLKCSDKSLLAPRESAQTRSCSKQTWVALMHRYCSCAEVRPTAETNTAVFGSKDLQVRSIFHDKAGKNKKWSNFRKNQ